MEPISLSSVDSRQILFQTEKFKVVCFVFEPGKGLPNHTHNGFATIQIISGSADMTFTDGRQFDLQAGDILAFDARIEHNVIAKETCKMVVTIVF